MLSKQLLTCLSLFLFFGTIKARDEWSCIEAKSIENFNFSRFAGLWFHYAIRDETHGNSACITYFLTLLPNNTYAVTRYWIDKSDNSAHEQMQNAVLNEFGQGKSLDGYQQTIVALDYDHYKVVLACDEKSNKLVAWVSTRESNPPSSSLEAVHDILSEYNLKISDLSLVDQSSCPTDWSNAVKAEHD